jgi:hypothetical protein
MPPARWRGTAFRAKVLLARESPSWGSSAGTRERAPPALARFLGCGARSGNGRGVDDPKKPFIVTINDGMAFECTAIP